MELKCVFKVEYTNLYVCEIYSVSIKKVEEKRVKSIIGDHIGKRSNNDVKQIRFENSIVEYFPRGLGRIFPNLTRINLNSCGLKKINREDLEGLENIEQIHLRGNKLTTLPSNLFEGMTKLKNIYFAMNKLEFISSDLLKPLMNDKLDYIDFQGNKMIDSYYSKCFTSKVKTIEQLMEIIDNSCKAPKNEENGEEIDQALDEYKDAHTSKTKKGFEELWASGNLSDFTINVGSKEFLVHKVLLRIHSPIYAKMFDEQNPDKMEIKDISAEAVNDFLRYLYTGEMPDPNNALNVFALAVKLEVDELKLICEILICKHALSEINAYKVFMLGHAYASDKLKVAAFNKIKSMFPDSDLTNDLMQEPEKLKKLIDHKRGIDNLLQSFKKYRNCESE